MDQWLLEFFRFRPLHWQFSSMLHSQQYHPRLIRYCVDRKQRHCGCCFRMRHLRYRSYNPKHWAHPVKSEHRRLLIHFAIVGNRRNMPGDHSVCRSGPMSVWGWGNGILLNFKSSTLFFFKDFFFYLWKSMLIRLHSLYNKYMWEKRGVNNGYWLSKFF